MSFVTSFDCSDKGKMEQTMCLSCTFLNSHLWKTQLIFTASLRLLLSCFPNHHRQTEFLYKALAVLEIVLWTRDFFASAS